MKNRKRLNNKGFTLIELLAVVVILAVVMGIAMSSVLSSMNNSRKGSLENSAKKVAQTLQTKYSEAMVTGSTKYVYSDVFGNNIGYDFSSASETAPVFYELTQDLSEDMNLSSSTYSLAAKVGTTAPANKVSDGKLTASKSFIAFNGKSVVTCMIAENGGNYFVSNAVDADGTTRTIHGVMVTFAANTMYACSIDGVNSWTPAS